ncbi:MAG: hypothetical protein HOP19_20930 [Acidobacteria bacterium]|nr:hypothetical protein [Acidobacteriota bacterium]
MNAQARLAKIESQIDGGICPICGTDRREQRVRDVEALAGALGRLWRSTGRSPESTLARFADYLHRCSDLLRRDATIGAEAIARAEMIAPTEAELRAVAIKQMVIYEKHVTRDVALKLLREEMPELADLLAG